MDVYAPPKAVEHTSNIRGSRISYIDWCHRFIMPLLTGDCVTTYRLLLICNFFLPPNYHGFSFWLMSLSSFRFKGLRFLDIFDQSDLFTKHIISSNKTYSFERKFISKGMGWFNFRVFCCCEFQDLHFCKIFKTRLKTKLQTAWPYI